MKLTIGRQCELTRGSNVLVAWIPQEFAIVNNIVDLKKPDGSWDKDWKVRYTWSLMPLAEVRKHQKIELLSLK